ncbi:MAG: AI-2E family transporter, partial [Candidatus Cloacimonetes bacterium]|nr:AI-2E family transporter [Candidatus Cloacimonadota bacterium]
MQDFKWLKIGLSIIIMAVVVYVLKTLKAIFIPLVFALFLTFMFAPLNRFLVNKKIPQPLVLIILVVIIFISFTLIGSLVYMGVASFANEYPKYERQMTLLLGDFINDFNAPTNDVAQFIKNNVKPSDIISKISFSSIIAGTMGTFVDFIMKLTLTVIFMLFIVAGKSRFINNLADVFTTDSSDQTNHI